MFVKVAHFKELIVSSFECPHCGNRNNEVRSAQSLSDRGCCYTVQVKTLQDLNRQVVSTESATIRLEEDDFEIPPSSEHSVLTTIEGIVAQCRSNLSDVLLRCEDSGVSEKLLLLTERFTAYLNGLLPFTFKLSDPSGNSYVEPLQGDLPETVQLERFVRTPEQLEELGYATEPVVNGQEPADKLDDRIQVFKTGCPNCMAETDTRMCTVEIPYFKNVVLMATCCEACGFKSNEIKTVGAVSEFGRRITLRTSCEEDLSRDLLKSETASLRIPELDFELGCGTLGGKFTTLEGILRDIYEELAERVPFAIGDSAQEQASSVKVLAEKIQQFANGAAFYSVVVDDPLANSYVQNFFAPDNDPQLAIEDYERSHEQNEDLGLNDICVGTAAVEGN